MPLFTFTRKFSIYCLLVSLISLTQSSYIPVSRTTYYLIIVLGIGLWAGYLFLIPFVASYLERAYVYETDCPRLICTSHEWELAKEHDQLPEVRHLVFGLDR